MRTTRNKFLVAVAAGIITCGGAIATATVSNADPSAPPSASGGSTSATGAPSSTSSAPSTDPTGPTTDPSSPATSTGSPTTTTAQPHVTVTPFLDAHGNGMWSVSYRIDGEVLAGQGNVLDYVDADIEVDGNHIPSAHPFPFAKDAQLRPIHVTHQNSFVFALAPGKHTVTVRIAYYIADGEFSIVTATRTITTGTGSKPAPTSSGPAQPGEPPTPSPKTTQLGVTG